MKYLSSFTLLTFVAVALGYGLKSVTGQEALVAALLEGGEGSLGGVGVEVEAPVGGAGVEDEESAGVQSILNPVRPVRGAGVEDENSAGIQAYPKVPKRKTAKKKKGCVVN